MKKILTLLFVFLLVSMKVESNEIDKAIKNSNIHKSSVSISVKNISNNKKGYELNPDQLMSPASIQKIITIIPSSEILGKDYNFSTKLYKTGNLQYHLVLGADPFLTRKDLSQLISLINLPQKSVIKSFYIDDSIMDDNDWGEGWQWDDDLNKLMPKFGAYNMDNNLYEIIISPTKKDMIATITQPLFYPTTYINQTITVSPEKDTEIIISRKNHISPDIISISGNVSKRYTELIPTNHPRRYFIFRLEDALNSHKLSYYGEFKRQKLPEKNIQLIGEIKHPIQEADIKILKNSNNMIAETVFKLAGGKFAKEQGSAQAGVDMFYDYCKQNGLNATHIKITDGSGVSKNNLMNTEFITNFLVFGANKYNYNLFKDYLPTPGEGTLANRLLYFKDNLTAKTGTLSNISAIAGYIETKQRNKMAFSIIINDANSKDLDKKMLEDYIIRAIYNEL